MRPRSAIGRPGPPFCLGLGRVPASRRRRRRRRQPWTGIIIVIAGETGWDIRSAETNARETLDRQGEKRTDDTTRRTDLPFDPLRKGYSFCTKYFRNLGPRTLRDVQPTKTYRNVHTAAI